MENDIKNEILELVDSLYKDYNLPPQNISVDQWDAFFYVIESHFLALNIMYDYAHALRIVVRRALYFAQTTNTDKFTIEHLKRALSDLTIFNISNEQINTMRNEIDTTMVKKKKI